MTSWFDWSDSVHNSLGYLGGFVPRPRHLALVASHTPLEAEYARIVARQAGRVLERPRLAMAEKVDA